MRPSALLDSALSTSGGSTMTLTRSGRVIALAAVALAVASAGWTLGAQDRPEEAARAPLPEAVAAAPARGPRPTVQEALLQVYPLPFAEDTALEAVAAHFRMALAAPVVLDLAALERQGLSPETT